METWLSGTGLARDYQQVTGRERTSRQIIADFQDGERDATVVVRRWEDRLARGLATVINILDPDVIVIGGGVSQAKHLYETVPKLLPKYVFGGEADTPIVQAKFGDSSGVRGAAWLWPLER
jgi:fructokinase